MSSWFALRRRRGKISVTITNTTNLLSDVARQIPNLKVFYQQKELAEELVWVAGHLINIGDLDIGKSLVSQFPILRLDEGIEWREFCLDDVPKVIAARSQILSASEVQLNWDLLRPNEAIRFWAVIRTTERSVGWALAHGYCMSVSARIENTDAEVG